MKFFLFEPFSKWRDWSSSSRKNLYFKPVKIFDAEGLFTSVRFASIVKVSRCSAISAKEPSSAYNEVEQLVLKARPDATTRGETPSPTKNKSCCPVVRTPEGFAVESVCPPRSYTFF